MDGCLGEEGVAIWSCSLSQPGSQGTGPEDYLRWAGPLCAQIILIFHMFSALKNFHVFLLQSFFASRQSSTSLSAGVSHARHLLALPLCMRSGLGVHPSYQAQTGRCSSQSQQDLSSGFSSRCSHPHSGGNNQTAPDGCPPGT